MNGAEILEPVHLCRLHAHLLLETLPFPQWHVLLFLNAPEPLSPEASILLALVGILHITKLHVVTA